MLEAIEAQIDRLNQQVIRLYKEGQYEQAMDVAKWAHHTARHHLDGNQPRSIASRRDLAWCYRETGSYVKAAPLPQEELEITQRAVGEEHADFVRSDSHLGLIYSLMGHYKAAKPLLKRAVELAESALGRMHPAYAEGLHNLGCSTNGGVTIAPLASGTGHQTTGSRRRPSQCGLDPVQAVIVLKRSGSAPSLERCTVDEPSSPSLTSFKCLC